MELHIAGAAELKLQGLKIPRSVLKSQLIRIKTYKLQILMPLPAMICQRHAVYRLSVSVCMRAWSRTVSLWMWYLACWYFNKFTTQLPLRTDLNWWDFKVKRLKLKSQRDQMWSKPLVSKINFTGKGRTIKLLFVIVDHSVQHIAT